MAAVAIVVLFVLVKACFPNGALKTVFIVNGAMHVNSNVVDH